MYLALLLPVTLACVLCFPSARTKAPAPHVPGAMMFCLTMARKHRAFKHFHPSGCFCQYRTATRKQPIHPRLSLCCCDRHFHTRSLSLNHAVCSETCVLRPFCYCVTSPRLSDSHRSGRTSGESPVGTPSPPRCIFAAPFQCLDVARATNVNLCDCT